ncbi:MAG TPA: nitroreductase family deazaflavin-dependent oxidoreductase, partial [Anaerolinea sp.]|nr:nitroreductase family deazaflavin-dependent oxidoreductase [Anaerolinea sp.]
MSFPTSPAKDSSNAAHKPGNQKPPAFLLPLMKMPLILYRLGLGWMLGKRFMLLTHVGRRSGKVYRTVLAVLKYDETTHEILAVSPWSASNWYRNIQATPALEVQTGSTRYAPVQRSLSPDEIASLFIEYRRQRPLHQRHHPDELQAALAGDAEVVDVEDRELGAAGG